MQLVASVSIASTPSFSALAPEPPATGVSQSGHFAICSTARLT
jgi:hypothetical protein